jgi:hypothetical protein
MVRKSAEEWLEAKNQCFHDVDELMERWNKRITLDNLRIDEPDGAGQRPLGNTFLPGLNRRDHCFFLSNLVDEFLAGIKVLVHQPRRRVGQPLRR